MTKKTLLGLAVSVQRKITYPSEVLLKKGDTWNFTILSKGGITFVCKGSGVKLYGMEVQSYESKEGATPRLVSLNFIKRKVLNWDVISKDYSVLYTMTHEEFSDILRESSKYDHQYFCFLKDKHDYFIDEVSTSSNKCPFCKNCNHTKF